MQTQYDLNNNNNNNNDNREGSPAPRRRIDSKQMLNLPDGAERRLLVFVIMITMMVVMMMPMMVVMMITMMVMMMITMMVVMTITMMVVMMTVAKMKPEKEVDEEQCNDQVPF